MRYWPVCSRGVDIHKSGHPACGAVIDCAKYRKRKGKDRTADCCTCCYYSAEEITEEEYERRCEDD